MKIAVLSSHTPSLFWFRMDMMREFLARGHEVYAVANEPEAAWARKFSEQGIVYRQIDAERNSVNPLKDLRMLRSIKGVLKEIRPDKIFTFQAKTVIYGGIAARQLGIREVYPLIAGLGSVFLGSDLKTKLVRKILIAEYRLGLRSSAAVFFQNSDDAQTFRSCGILKRQKVTMLHGSGVNTERFQPAPFPETFAFLCISRLIRDKGVYEYLEACRAIRASHPDVRCLLVGPFDSNPSALQPEELRRFVDAGAVEYFGEQADVRPYLAQCSVFVLPSYREGTPKTVLEAMATGRCVITTDAPGCRETVPDGKNGVLIPPKDAAALVAQMEYMIGHPEEAIEKGKAGRAIAEDLFDVRKVNQAICETMQI